MLRVRSCDFARDERGAGTIMGLLWFVLLVGITGMAVDITNGFRNRTMLQATADASALAAVIDLPIVTTADESAAVATAVAYSQINMPTVLHGNVLVDAGVVVGDWNAATKSITSSTGFPTAVFVTTRRADANGNPVPTNFLRILRFAGINLDRWNVQAQAVAERYIPECLNDGLIARGLVEISSNNTFVKQICIHSQTRVKVQQHNFWEPGVSVSMPDYHDLQVPSDDISTNINLEYALRDMIFDPRMVDHVPNIIATLSDPTLDATDERTNIIPDFITATEAVNTSAGSTTSAGTTAVENTNPLVDIAVVSISLADFNALLPSLAVASVTDDGPGLIYDVNCSGTQKVVIPKNIILTDMVIVSGCKINVGTDATLSDVVLAAAGGNGQIHGSNIHLAAGVTLGRNDNCAEGGGVQLFSTQSITNASTLSLYGVQIVAQGNVHIAAQAFGINGISVQAGGDIQVTSNNGYGLCQGGAPNLFTADYYRLVL